MDKLKYDIDQEGKVGVVGFDNNLPFAVDGSEPWADNWTDAYQWQNVAGVWKKWFNELDIFFPEKTISQLISSPEEYPNIKRSVHVGRIDINVWINEITFEFLIRHERQNGTLILEYDEIVKFRLNNAIELQDPAGGKKGAYSLFLLRMVRDDIEFTENIKQLISLMDNKNIFNGLITKY
jgi:hypothetical protein